MKARLGSLGMILLVIFSSIYIISGSMGSTPPEDGDWVITGETIIMNESISLIGNLTIKSGGSLTLSNTDLVISSSYSGEFRIDVEEGGAFSIYNSSISAFYEKHHYKFYVLGKLEAINSTITDLWGDLAHIDRYGGIEIGSNDTFLESTIISNAVTNGLSYNFSKVNVNNCRFENCGDDVIEMFDSRGEISNCTITNSEFGIFVRHSEITIENNLFTNLNNSVISTYNSTFEIYNNTIDNATEGVRSFYNPDGIIHNNTIKNCLVGFEIYLSGYEINDNKFINNTAIGIYLDRSSPHIFNNSIWCAEELRRPNYSDIVCWFDSSPLIENCTFSSIESGYYSHPRLIYTTFNKSAMYVHRLSSIKVQYLFTVSVFDMNGTPVEGAEVYIAPESKQELLTFITTDEGIIPEFFLDGLSIETLEDYPFSTSAVNVSYYILARKGNYSGYTELNLDGNTNVAITIGPHDPPEIIDYSPDKSPVIDLGDVYRFEINASDESMNLLTYEWFLDGVWKFKSIINYFDLYTKILTDGKHNLTVIISDGIYNLSHNWELTILNESLSDSDDDGVINAYDVFPKDPSEWYDSDGDDWGDNSDTDDDNDGYNDNDEIRFDTDPLNPESTPTDLDNDFIPDKKDFDRDGDSVPNDVDEYPDDPERQFDIVKERDEQNNIHYGLWALIVLVVSVLLLIMLLIIPWLNKRYSS